MLYVAGWGKWTKSTDAAFRDTTTTFSGRSINAPTEEMEREPGRCLAVRVIGTWTERWNSPYEVCFNLDNQVVRVSACSQKHTAASELMKTNHEPVLAMLVGVSTGVAGEMSRQAP
jgi:hypothetical protein